MNGMGYGSWDGGFTKSQGFGFGESCVLAVLHLAMEFWSLVVGYSYVED